MYFLCFPTIIIIQWNTSYISMHNFKLFSYIIEINNDLIVSLYIPPEMEDQVVENVAYPFRVTKTITIS